MMNMPQVFFSDFPIVEFEKNRFMCPLPDLLLFRVTNFIHLDLRKAEGQVRNDFSENFENYIIDLSRELFREFTVTGEFKYNTGKKGHDRMSPDVFLKKDNNISVVIDCKTTGVGFDAKFNQNDLTQLPKHSSEIIRGFKQIWRFHSDVMKGLVSDTQFSDKPFGMILTLEPWLFSYEEFITNAIKMADEEDIPEGSRIPILIMSVSEFEAISKSLDETNFLLLLQKALLPEYLNWFVTSVMQNEMEALICDKEFPIDQKLSEVSNIWKFLEEYRQKLNN